MTLWLALVLLGPQEEAVRKLIEQLSSDSIDAREEASLKLEGIGAAAVPLLERAARDSDGEVSSRAKILLIRIPIRERLTPSIVEHVKGIHERLAQGEWKAVFLELAEDLRLPEDRRRFPGVRAEDLAPLAPMAAQHASSELDKARVCEAVGRLKLGSAMAEMARLLRDDRSAVRAAAAAAIRDAGARDRAADLRPLLADPDPVVRSVAVHALARLGSRESVAEAARLLGDRSADVRWWAVRALGELDARECAGQIENLSGDSSPAVRRIAEETAARLRRAP